MVETIPHSKNAAYSWWVATDILLTRIAWSISSRMYKFSTQRGLMGAGRRPVNIRHLKQPNKEKRVGCLSKLKMSHYEEHTAVKSYYLIIVLKQLPAIQLLHIGHQTLENWTSLVEGNRSSSFPIIKGAWVSKWRINPDNSSPLTGKQADFVWVALKVLSWTPAHLCKNSTNHSSIER